MTDEQAAEEKLRRIEALIDVERALLRERRYAEFERHIEQTYPNPDIKHKMLCRMFWEKGERQRALDETISRIRSGNYALGHLFQAAHYAHALHDLQASDFLQNDLNSKFEETDSISLISYVYKVLRGIEPTREERKAAEMLLPKGASGE